MVPAVPSTAKGKTRGNQSFGNGGSRELRPHLKSRPEAGKRHEANDADNGKSARTAAAPPVLTSGWLQFPGSVHGGGLPAPFAAVVDGNDNVWVSNLAMAHSPVAHLCGVRTENCPPGMKTGDQISPAGGYVGGGLQRVTDLAVSPAGDVWVMNNWQITDSCFLNTNKDEALSTRCGGNGVTIFFGMAKPVRAPQIGPARPY